MTELQDKLVLVSQAALFDIAGSEVVCFEVARYFAVHAASVIVVTYGYSPQWEAQFSSLPNVSLYRFDDAALDVRLGERSPDLAWIHHQLIPEPLLRNASATTFVFHHMSAFQLQEFPLSPSIERSLASSIVFPAVETRGSQLSSGLLEGVPSRRLLVFGNPAPDEFYAEPVDWAARPERPRTVLIVSNHPPAELQAAVALLDPTIRVSTLGGDSAAGATKRLVVPSDIKDVDVVVSIGKTVQYAVVGGVPVYCYDHFGGPGWLTPENFDAARRANFSGRGFPKKPAAAIAEEIMEGFAQAAADARVLHGAHASEFLMSTAMDRLFSHLTPIQQSPIDETEMTAFLARQKVFNGLINAIQARVLTAEYRQGLLLQSENERAALRARLDRVESTPGLGMAMRTFGKMRRLRDRFLSKRST